ncbi:hypothetical protein PSPO01_12462 [Paraphaeosphaeria sporulosa]
MKTKHRLGTGLLCSKRFTFSTGTHLQRPNFQVLLRPPSTLPTPSDRSHPEPTSPITTSHKSQTSLPHPCTPFYSYLIPSRPNTPPPPTPPLKPNQVKPITPPPARARAKP